MDGSLTASEIQTLVIRLSRPPQKGLEIAISALTPAGGGDCPELSQEGLRRAVDKAIPKSCIYLFTDASAKGSHLANLVISEAQRKSIRLNYALTGSCSPIDEGMSEERVKLEVKSSLSISSRSHCFTISSNRSSRASCTILTATGTLNGPSESTIPVDSTLSTLVVSVSSETPTLVQLRRPSGESVTSGDSNVKITQLSLEPFTRFRVRKPEAGT